MNNPDLTYEYPRNIWSRYRAALRHIGNGNFYQAQRCIDGVKYHPAATADIQQIYQQQLTAAMARAGTTGKVNIPADYLGHDNPALTPPFRRFPAQRDVPRPYPPGLMLPGFAGARNDYQFLLDAAARLAPQHRGNTRRVHLVYAPDATANVAQVLSQARALRFDGTLQISLFADPQNSPSNPIPTSDGLTLISHGLLDPQAPARLEQIAASCDLVLFLSGSAEFDPNLLQRALPLADVSDTAVQFFSQMTPGAVLQSPFSRASARAQGDGRYPFVDVEGLNFAVPSALLSRVGPPDCRFDNLFLAGQELAFRMYNAGAYFIPLPLPRLRPANDPASYAGDRALYVGLCPISWDRPEDGHFEIPRVSVYIPAYNASRYIERAVDSVLQQDVMDLDVCIANDGARDSTLALLERQYGNEPRVRWVSNRNGGIGYASNQAIRMSNSLYIGQLDSDDCLKPGAVRRMMEFLDEHPETVCCYGSCERIDADGQYIKDEYSWPVYSREKFMVTSIAHHFRMFRRRAWERSSYFREDIVNAVDYDIFLKLAETGAFHHIDEKLYQRRWHGENTSSVNESFQTANTYRVQREALARLGLARFWDVHVENPQEPRRVTYKRHGDKQMLLFWPDYARHNPYQKLLYGPLRQEMEIVAGDIDAALMVLDQAEDPGQITFHLHWLNFLLRGIRDAQEAAQITQAFIAKLERFVAQGGQLVWTVHNHLSHDTPFPALEAALSTRIAQLAGVLHVHSAASIDELAAEFGLPRDKIQVSRHGSYVGYYPETILPGTARDSLGLDARDDVILFTGQLRPYKGVEQLISVFRRLLADRPHARLILAGMQEFDPFENLSLTPAERDRIHSLDRFVEDEELQVLLQAADMAVYPYQKILTSGSLLLALSFGVPTVIPDVGMTREVLAGSDAGVIYDGSQGEAALERAMRAVLARKDAGTLPQMQACARQLAETLSWPDFGKLVRRTAPRHSASVQAK